jgi:hypothetical protein
MLGFALALGSILTTGATAGYLAAASMIVGIYTANEQRKKAQRAADSKISDRNVMVREATADRPHLFGRIRTSGQVQFPGTSGDYAERLHFVVALGDEIDAVEEVWFGDSSIGARDANGFATEAPYGVTRTEPAFGSFTVSTSQTVTLPQLATAISSVASGSTFDYDGGTTFYAGDPATDDRAYSSATVGGVTVLTFAAAQIGRAVVVNYSYSLTGTYARAKAFLGASGQAADPYLIAALPTTWSASDKFTGTSYISGTWVANNDIYPTGILDVSAVIRGEKCYDPRTSTTVWTRNPALIAWKYISKRFPNETYDSASLIAAANVCDEEVAIDGSTTHARYTYDDSISSETDHKAGLERILQAMVGSAVRVAGTWYIWAGAWEAPSLALDEDDLAPGEIIVQGVAEDGSLFNGIGGRYTDPTKWVEDSFPAYVSPAYVALDNGETEILDVDLTQITDVQRAQRVARLMLHKARQALTFACTLEMSAYALYPGRMVTWTIDRYGWDEKPFRCLSRVYSPSTGTLQCIFQEDAEAIYASSYSELTNVDPAPNTNLPNPLIVAVPVLTFASGAEFVTIESDGSQRPYLRAYWQQMDESVESIEFWCRKANATTWQTAIVAAENLVHDIYGVSRDQVYVVQARAINGIGVRSAWVFQSVTISPDAAVNGGSFTGGIGVNLHSNTRMLSSASPWRYHFNAGTYFELGADYAEIPFGRVAHVADGNTHGAQRPIPFNALAVIWLSGGTASLFGGYTNYLVAPGTEIPCRPGDRIEAQVYAAQSGGSAKVDVQFLDASGADLGIYGLGLNNDLHTLYYTETEYTGLGSLELFKQIYGFVTAPASAAIVRLVLRPGRNVTSGVSYVSFAMPYIGMAHALQTTPSGWSIGPET